MRTIAIGTDSVAERQYLLRQIKTYETLSTLQTPQLNQSAQGQARKPLFIPTIDELKNIQSLNLWTP